MRSTLHPGRRRKKKDKPTEDGYVFDSEPERMRYLQLAGQQESGVISGLVVKPLYVLEVQGVLISRFRPDFAYCGDDGRIVVEDVKGWKVGGHRVRRGKLVLTEPKPLTTEVYQMNKRLMLAIYGITVVEV
jgi:hypothetical protein